MGANRRIIIKCIVCKKFFEAGSHKAAYCPSCRRKEQNKLANEAKHRSQIKAGTHRLCKKCNRVRVIKYFLGLSSTCLECEGYTRREIGRIARQGQKRVYDTQTPACIGYAIGHALAWSSDWKVEAE